MALEVPDLHHPLAHREHERPPDAEEFVCGLVVHSYDMGLNGPGSSSCRLKDGNRRQA
jgi:hypothetical protein